MAIHPNLTQRLYSLISLVLFYVSLAGLCHAADIIRYPQAGDIYQKLHIYPVALLNLSLSYAEEDYQTSPSTRFMPQGRAIKQLAQSKDIDVLWTMTSTQREVDILPVRVPIYKGLIGWRLFLTTQDNPKLVNKEVNNKNIRDLLIIQGHDWPDTKILEHNGFNVHSGPDYLGLFKILSLNRADLFPRSIIEVWQELDEKHASNIVLEQNNVISYPTATYFFVSPDNKALASTIESGLRAAIADGNFDRLFHEHYGELINRAKLAKRTHHRLLNPLLPSSTPLSEKSLWFAVEQE